MIGFRDALLVLACTCVGAGTFASESPAESGPPGPMPVVHARPGEAVTFHCYAYSPCAEVVVEDSGDGARSYVATIDSELAGGFGVDTHGNAGFTPEEEAYMCAQDTWCLGGFGFGASAGQKFSHQVPHGTARTWAFGFAPLSGEDGGDVRLVVELSDGPARVPAWR
jgi:hypothetical protein